MFLIEKETEKAKMTVAIVTTSSKTWNMNIWIPKSVKNEERFVTKKAFEIIEKYRRCNGITVSCGSVFVGS